MSVNICYLSLGSNMGDRYQYLQDAVRLLGKDPHIHVLQLSSVYETDPVGHVEQDLFLNMVVKIDTGYSPEELLEKVQEIELDLDRKRSIRWGPRTIDIDILLYNDIEMCTTDLTIPHPRMMERAFVLVPLAEIAPDRYVQGDSLSIAEHADSVWGDEGIYKWKHSMEWKEGEKR